MLRRSLDGADRFDPLTSPATAVGLLVALTMPLYFVKLGGAGDGYREGRDGERALLVSEETRSWIRLSGFRPADFRGTAALSNGSGVAPQPLGGGRPSAPTSS
jgi:hypothetical protein